MCALLCTTCGVVAHAAPAIVFDYTYDSSGFFADPLRRGLLGTAAESVNRWVDSLAPIVPSGGNTWTGQVVRPDTGIGILIPGAQLSVPADVIRVYAGARDLGPTHLGAAEKNGAVASGSDAWKELVAFRGQTPGPPYVDYGPWGGSITFNPNFDWYFGADPSDLLPTQYDFLTVAAHELTHVLGFGVAESYNAQVQDARFVGPKALAAGSMNNPSLQIDADGDHWAEGTLSTVAGTGVLSLMTPIISPGQRLRLTDLDAAALDDIGWEAATPGDANRDGVVDIYDVNLVSSHWGDPGGFGDTNYDGMVDIFDVNVISSNWTNGGGGAAVVPEPATAVMATAAVAWLLFVHRRGPAGR